MGNERNTTFLSTNCYTIIEKKNECTHSPRYSFTQQIYTEHLLYSIHGMKFQGHNFSEIFNVIWWCEIDNKQISIQNTLINNMSKISKSYGKK